MTERYRRAMCEGGLGVPIWSFVRERCSENLGPAWDHTLLDVRHDLHGFHVVLGEYELVTCRNVKPQVLGVKGSQVQILSSRHCRPDTANKGGVRFSGAALAASTSGNRAALISATCTRGVLMIAVCGLEVG